MVYEHQESDLLNEACSGQQHVDSNGIGEKRNASLSLGVRVTPAESESLEAYEVEEDEGVNYLEIPAKTPWQRFKRFLSASRNWIGVILARLLFLVLALLIIGLAVASSLHTTEWAAALFTPIILLPAELIITLKFKGCKEWKWGTPCIFAFLMCTVPAIWIMEYRSYDKRISLSSQNLTTPPECEDTQLTDISNSFTSMSLKSHADVGKIASSASNAANKLCLCNDCAPYMEQVMLFSLIIGRWILPKAKGITTDQKAQLLLVNIAVAADILELYELMKEERVYTDLVLIFIVLGVWTFSLLQFGIVSTATTERRQGCAECFNSEMWSLVTLLCMDDLSFLVLRLTFAIKYKIISYASLFFVSKNCLVLILDLNRIIALHNATVKSRKQPLSYKPSIARIRR